MQKCILAAMTPSQAISALVEHGMPEASIAAAVGVSQPSINRIRREVMQPNYELGSALVALAKRQLRRRKPKGEAA